MLDRQDRIYWDGEYTSCAIDTIATSTNIGVSKQGMALIKISDLNTADCDLFTQASSFLTELPLAEIESIRGGQTNGPLGRIAIATAAFIPSLQVSFNIDSGDATSGSGTFRIAGNAGDPNGISYSIEGKKLDRAGNFFYTNNGNAPLGGTPIPGFPGAYTF